MIGYIFFTIILLLFSLKSDKIKLFMHLPFSVIKRERDIVREVTLDGNRVHLAVLDVEQQSEIDYSMALRTLVYDTLEYLKQARMIEQEHKRKKDVRGREFLSHFKKEDIMNCADAQAGHQFSLKIGDI